MWEDLLKTRFGFEKSKLLAAQPACEVWVIEWGGFGQTISRRHLNGSKRNEGGSCTSGTFEVTDV